MSLTLSNNQPSCPQFPLTQQIWHKAWQDPHAESLESLCAKIACIVFPIIFTVALVEGTLWIGRQIWDLCSGEGRIHPPLPDGWQTQAVKTVPLDAGSSQYDITSEKDPQNQRPPACTFHAMNGASSIAREFERWAERIETRDFVGLSRMQRVVIERGLRDYNSATLVDRAFVQGADLENIKNRWPDLLDALQLHFAGTNQQMQPVAVRTQAIADWLFAERQQKNVAWIKSGNEESFAVISYNGRAIIFDSHNNEITLVRGEDQTQAFLTAKLAPHSHMEDNNDLNAFSYAVGRYT